MSHDISTVAVLGGGTMGSGIAAACAEAGCRVLLLDVTPAAADKALARVLATAETEEGKAALTERITLGTLADDLPLIAGYDWVCEAVIEDLATKRDLFRRLEALRRPDSVVSTNTSGIPLRAILDGQPESLRRGIAVTHFFNPVKVMKLLELVAGPDTEPRVIEALATFGRTKLGKGVVHAKDTVNFIGNRIGCFWMLSGLHLAKPYLEAGLDQETVDALLSAPVGLPSTGFYGLIDLIGLDVMDFVGKNLAVNLPEGDAGRAFTRFPAVEQALLERGQLGRKSGGGFYRVTRNPDGSRTKETFDLVRQEWRPTRTVTLAPEHADAGSLLFADTAEGRFAWDVVGGTLLYAADLVPEIADDVVNVDRALRWGFAWRRGPFQFLDALGPKRVIERLERDGKALPRHLAVLKAAGAETFYRGGEAEFLGTDGRYHPVPAA